MNPAFDADGGYVWRDQDTGRELTADEVEALGYDVGVRDSPETWAPRYVDYTQAPTWKRAENQPSSGHTYRGGPSKEED